MTSKSGSEVTQGVVSFGKWYHSVMVSYYCSIVTLSVIGTIFVIFDFKNAVTLKTG